jgi:hypothetical protein
MNEVLLAETIGRDTASQVWRDEAGAYRIRVLALPEEGAERVSPTQSPHVFKEWTVGAEEAQRLFQASSAKRYVAREEAFPKAG